MKAKVLPLTTGIFTNANKLGKQRQGFWSCSRTFLMSVWLHREDKCLRWESSCWGEKKSTPVYKCRTPGAFYPVVAEHDGEWLPFSNHADTDSGQWFDLVTDSGLVPWIRGKTGYYEAEVGLFFFFFASPSLPLPQHKQTPCLSPVPFPKKRVISSPIQPPGHILLNNRLKLETSGNTKADEQRIFLLW